MAFQILNKDNIPVIINQLDEEAANLWKKQVHKTKYAHPFGEEPWSSGNNWYDVIGFRISSIKYIESNTPFPLEVIKVELAETFDHAVENPAFAKPFYDLINFWVDKGYQAIKL